MVQKEYAQVSDNAKVNYYLKETKDVTILFCCFIVGPDKPLINFLCHYCEKDQQIVV